MFTLTGFEADIIDGDVTLIILAPDPLECDPHDGSGADPDNCCLPLVRRVAARREDKRPLVG